MRFSWTASCALLLPAALWAADAPRVVYTKTFKGSTPAYIQITLERDGKGVYAEDPNDDTPLRFELDPPAVDSIFELTAKLDFFKRQLESGLKVAFMGEKAFRWENGAERHEVKFNYTQDETAQALHEWFEKISESAFRLARLERTIRFDRLGVNQALLDVQTAWDRGRIVTPKQFLPWLDRIAKNETFMHMSRERAAALAEAFRAGKPKTN